jgi:thiamine-phosphate pyrophosphorylase
MPRLYVILDAGLMKDSAEQTAKQLIDAGVRMFQYRSKRGAARETLEVSRKLAETAAAAKAAFFVNDRADIAYLAGATGVHVGQTDLSVEEARELLGIGKWIGVSTHNEEQFRTAMETTADYVAIGPVFATKSKENPDPVVGLEFVRRMRRLTDKPIVAIGGMTPARAAEAVEAGADSVSVMGDILTAANPGERAQEFLRVLRIEQAN